MKSIEIETEIPDITYLVTKAGLNKKSTETRCKYLKSTKVALNRRSAGIEKKKKKLIPEVLLLPLYLTD